MVLGREPRPRCLENPRDLHLWIVPFALPLRLRSPSVFGACGGYSPVALCGWTATSTSSWLSRAVPPTLWGYQCWESRFIISYINLPPRNWAKTGQNEIQTFHQRCRVCEVFNIKGKGLISLSEPWLRPWEASWRPKQVCHELSVMAAAKSSQTQKTVRFCNIGS